MGKRNNPSLPREFAPGGRLELILLMHNNLTLSIERNLFYVDIQRNYSRLLHIINYSNY